MVSHEWAIDKDFEYVTLDDGLEVVSGSIKLDSSTLSGSAISDIRDSTRRFLQYDEFITSTDIESGTTDIVFYYRVGPDDTIDDQWTEWIEIESPIERIEHTILVFNDLIAVDYPVDTFSGIYREVEWRENNLANDYAQYAVIDTTTAILNQYPDDTDNVTAVYTPLNTILSERGRYVQWKATLTSTTSGSTPNLNSVNINHTLDIANQINNAFPSIYRRV